MRQFFDAILAFIGSSALTDDEFESIDVNISATYDAASYEGLLAVLRTRENATYQGFKLKAYYIAKGVSASSKTLNVIASEDTANIPKSNILIGSPL